MFLLVYYEHFQDVEIAIARGKQLKGWTRLKKKKYLIKKKKKKTF